MTFDKEKFMAVYLKAGRDAAAAATVQAEIRIAVERALTDIADRGDDAVREMSVRFDGWHREDFRLSQAEIDACIATLDEDALADIRFAQQQVRNFAELQLKSMRPVERETLPG